MSEAVWVSMAMSDSRITRSFKSDLQLANTQLAIESRKHHHQGDALAPGEFPKELYAERPYTRKEQLGDLFLTGNGFLFVSSAVADVLRQFDLGRGGLFPVRVLQRDGITPVTGEYYFLNIGAQREGFLPEECPLARRPWKGVDVWFPPTAMKDGQVAVSRDVLAGADLWADPKLHNSLFFSAPLADELKAANVSRQFYLRKCRVI